LTETGEGGLPARAVEAISLAANYTRDVALSGVYLRECNEVGTGVRVYGEAPRIDNRGFISLGARTCFLGQMGPLVLRTGPAGRIIIGEGCIFNFGTLISANRSVSIGRGSSFGQYCLVADTDSVDRADGAEASAIEIGEGVWLAARVTVLPGTRIGNNSVITAGSIVSGEIPAGVVAGGVPARVLRPLAPGETGADVRLTARPSAPAADAVAAADKPENPAPPAAPRQPAARGYIVSDFTIGELERRLNDPTAPTLLDFEAAPFDSVVPSLLGPAPPERDVLVVWTRPEAAVPAFDRLLGYETVGDDELLKQVEEHAELILQAASKYRAVFVPTWVIPPYKRTLGMLDGKPGGATRALSAMNLRLMDKLAAAPNVFVLNAERWTATAGRSAQQPKLWYLGKVPFHADVFAEAAADIRAGLSGLSGGARKLLILDLDDTLWGGIVGDAGVDGLRLGGHDSVGEAFVDFQRAVKQLKRRGIILGIVSKNTESVALEAIRTHSEMVLREEDFVGWRINWQDKARNVADLVAELNLGLSAAVFIDDNPVERARVREALPEVLVPEWPEDKLLYASTLRALRCFDAPALSREDAERTEMYAAERKRDNLKTQLGSLDDWLSSLKMQVSVDALSRKNLARTAQLLNKTNQMNLTTRRLTEAELEAWAADPQHEVLTINVADKFGDAGLTGILSVEHQNDVTKVVDFVLSCRVMGRKVEETLLHVAVASAQRRGAKRLEAHYIETKKNKPCLEFWERSGCERSDQVFSWDLTKPYLCPAPIQLKEERS
jgi:FkbH-like protein